MPSRRSWRIIGAEGIVDWEATQLATGVIEVSETDSMGDQTGPISQCHSWDAARVMVGKLAEAALQEQRI